MEGYEVITSDGDKVGQVVATQGDNLIVEHGALFKSRNALPNAFAEVDESERTVRTTLTKDLIHESPKVSGDDLDESEVAAYYGLPGGNTTEEGWGVLDEHDPTESAALLAERQGMRPADQERAEVRENMGAGETYGSPGRQIIPPDPHTTGHSGDEK